MTVRKNCFYAVIFAACFMLFFFGYRDGIIYELKPLYNEASYISINFLRQYYSLQARERVNQLNSITNASNHATLYNVLVPEVYCPNLVRVGNVNDGGKWVCNPLAMPQHNCRWILRVLIVLGDAWQFSSNAPAFKINIHTITILLYLHRKFLVRSGYTSITIIL
uniref:Methyltranfer_dom domain-containing protein n=1 Tax=Heterorhabditis bacteriophora TaxID=37862 RepID=A0A1I7WW22_HETBA